MQSLGKLGELGIIRIMEEMLGTSSRVAVGFGDDISAVNLTNGNVLVLKTDMLVGSTDVPPGMTMQQAARKAVVANVSDMAVKGVKPLAGVVALGLPATLFKKDVSELARGLGGAANEFGFPLVGGDTNESNDLIISIALFGIAKKKQLVLRSGARVGDIVAVTGEFGSTAAGLEALIKKKIRPNLLPRQLYDSVYYPRAQLDLGLRLAASGAVTASIDSSDGLGWSLHQVAEASNVGMRIDCIPISKAALNYATKFQRDPMELALYGGEEYHLVLTINRNKVALAQRAARGKLRVIGTVTPRSSHVSLRVGKRDLRIERKGWEHFRHSK